MNTITATGAAIIPANDLQTSLFNEFISFIDRGEKTTRTYITNLRQFAAWLKYASIARPIRQDIISYRDYLSAEHDAIQLDAAEGWTYRRDKNGNRIKVKCKPNTIAQYLRSVAQFFRWTAAAGLYPNIAENIHAPKIRHDTHKKDALTAADVLKIEKSIQAAADEKKAAAAMEEKDTAGRIIRATEQGKRDYAVLMLAIKLGMRTSDIRNLRPSNIDWNRHMISFTQVKTGEPLTLPLPLDVGWAVIDYLKNGRPVSDTPEIFLRAVAPYESLQNFDNILIKHMRKAEIPLDSIKHHGLHTLRHSLATHMLDEDIPITSIQSVLGHVDADSTQKYIGVDVRQLRSCALEVTD